MHGILNGSVYTDSSHLLIHQAAIQTSLLVRTWVEHQAEWHTAAEEMQSSLFTDLPVSLLATNNQRCLFLSLCSRRTGARWLLFQHSFKVVFHLIGSLVHLRDRENTFIWTCALVAQSMLHFKTYIYTHRFIPQNT